MLEKHLEITTDAGERKAIAKRIAVLYEDALKQREQAVRAWETVLEIDASDGDALESLAQLHLAGGAFRELADVYARKLELATRPEERRMLFAAERARLRGEADRARAGDRAAAQPAGGDAGRRRGAVVAGSDLHQRRAARGPRRGAGHPHRRSRRRPQERDELAFRAARLTETELSDVEAAIGRYQGILAATPDHAGTREALGAIARGDDYRVPAIAVLEPILRSGARLGAR